MHEWGDGTVPRAVAEAAAGRGLGGAVTRAAATRVTRPVALLAVPMVIGAMVLVGHLTVLVGLGGIAPTVTLVVLVLGAVVFGMRLRSGAVLHLYERGAVIERPRRAVQALDWAELEPYEQYLQWIPGMGGQRQVLTIEVGRRTVFTCLDEEATRLADVISAVELGRARAVLAAGGAVRYGFVTVTRDELAVPAFSIPWAEITGMRVGDLLLRVYGPAGPLTVLPRQSVPHQRSLVTLAEQLGATARQAG